MPNIILAFAILLLTNITGNAQCSKKINWYASKAEMIDENGQVTEAKEGITISTDKSGITLAIREKPNQIMEGTIKEITCDWKDAFINGKTIYKTEMLKANGESSNGTVTIDAKDGKITILLEIEKLEGKKIRITVDKYEEGDNNLPVPRSLIGFNFV